MQRLTGRGQEMVPHCWSARPTAFMVTTKAIHRGIGQGRKLRSIGPNIVPFNGSVTVSPNKGCWVDDELDAIDAQVADAIEAAVEFAASSPFPDASEVTTDVYVNYEEAI